MEIKNYEGLYTIDRQGNVFSEHYKKILKPCVRNGCYTICLTKNKIRKQFSIHKLIGQHFIENPMNYPSVDFFNGNRLDYSIDNLQWVSRSAQQLNTKIKN